MPRAIYAVYVTGCMPLGRGYRLASEASRGRVAQKVRMLREGRQLASQPSNEMANMFVYCCHGVLLYYPFRSETCCVAEVLLRPEDLHKCTCSANPSAIFRPQAPDSTYSSRPPRLHCKSLTLWRFLLLARTCVGGVAVRFW